MLAAIDVRRIAERASAHPTGPAMLGYWNACQRLERTVEDAPSYYAYEVASCSGRIATRLLGHIGGVNASEERSEAKRLADTQAELIGEFPRILLVKQEIVQIAVEVLLVLGGDGGARSDQLGDLVLRGMNAARQRGNQIFLAQMTIVESLRQWTSGGRRRVVDGCGGGRSCVSWD
jgi:hypothetical protein